MERGARRATAHGVAQNQTVANAFTFILTVFLAACGILTSHGTRAPHWEHSLSHWTPGQVPASLSEHRSVLGSDWGRREVGGGVRTGRIPPLPTVGKGRGSGR